MIVYRTDSQLLRGRATVQKVGPRLYVVTASDKLTLLMCMMREPRLTLPDSYRVHRLRVRAA